MHVIDTLGFCLSLLGIYDLLLYSQYLLPRYTVPPLSVLLNETEQQLRHAEDISAIPLGSEYKTQLDRLVDQFTMMRVESNQARGTPQQLRLAIQHGLTWRLCTLRYQIAAIGSSLELAIDQHHLAIIRSTLNRVGPSPTAATTMNNATESTLPLPVTAS